MFFFDVHQDGFLKNQVFDLFLIVRFEKIMQKNSLEKSEENITVIIVDKFKKKRFSSKKNKIINEIRMQLKQKIKNVEFIIMKTTQKVQIIKIQSKNKFVAK